MRPSLRKTVSIAKVIVLTGVIASGLILPNVGSAQLPVTVTIDASDYAYRALDTLRAGPTILALRNHGKVRHEVILLKLKPGLTLADYMRDTSQQARVAVTDQVIGLVLANAGEHAPGKLLVDLAPKSTYLVVCRLRDAPDKPPHVALGMITTLHVK
ncbi:MAG TPA: hypothetical protein VJ672_15585 [Gemmatimonadaceae bacterium]|nr:hypothetical protein [Gemmatimonadaceae bacterium]